VTHPSGVIGVAELAFTLNDDKKFAAIKAVYEDIHVSANSGDGGAGWSVGKPIAGQRGRTRILLHAAEKALRLTESRTIHLTLLAESREGSDQSNRPYSIKGKLGDVDFEISLEYVA
jgi:hypothetical protein